MARTLDTGGRIAKREDLHALDPEGIIFDINDNTRWHPPGQEFKLNLAKVVRYAKQFVDPKVGQLQNIVIRIAEGKKPKFVAGAHRLAAAIMAKKGSEEHGIEPHPDFLIRCTVKDYNEVEAIEAGIRENKEREGTTAIDDADNLRRLRNLGRDDKQIMEVLGCSDKWLGTLEKLLRLPDEIKLAVHTRLLSVENAADLADRPKEEQQSVLATALAEVRTPIERELDGQVSPEVGATLARMALSTEQARQEVGLNGDGNGKAGKKPKAANGKQARQLNTAVRKAMKTADAAKGKQVKRDRKEILGFWETLAVDENATEPQKLLAKAIADHASGKKGDQALKNLLDKVLRQTVKD